MLTAINLLLFYLFTVTSSGGGFRGFLETYFGPSSGATKLNLNHKQMLIILSSSLLIIFLNFPQKR